MGRDPARRDRGALEAEVLATLAAAQRALTPAEVLEGLGRDLAYTTVMTTLSRLHTKGALVREREGRAYAYRLATSPGSMSAALTARQMRRLLDAGDDRTRVLARFVGELDADEEKILTAILAQEPENRGDGS